MVDTCKESWRADQETTHRPKSKHAGERHVDLLSAVHINDVQMIKYRKKKLHSIIPTKMCRTYKVMLQTLVGRSIHFEIICDKKLIYSKLFHCSLLSAELCISGPTKYT